MFIPPAPRASHSHVDEVVIISGICFLPDTLGHHAKHGTTVELEMTGFDGMKFHGAKILRTGDWGLGSGYPVPSPQYLITILHRHNHLIAPAQKLIRRVVA